MSHKAEKAVWQSDIEDSLTTTCKTSENNAQVFQAQEVIATG